MRAAARKIGRNCAAAVLLVIGIAGLFLPVIQGVATIVLAILVADFAAKDRLIERYRHTKWGAKLHARHEARKRRDAERDGERNGGIVPESAPAPPPTGEAASGEERE